MFIGIGKCCRKDRNLTYALRHGLWYFFTVLALSVMAEQSSLQVKNAWIKLAPPGASVNAGYMELYNSSEKNISIDKLESSCCEKLMLHRTIYEGDGTKMIHVDKLVISAKDHLRLQPGGLHIMLIKPSPGFQLGDEVAIKMQLSNGQQQTVYFPVKAGDDENNK